MAFKEFATGFAGGFAKSVTEAIEEEQKSLDKLFDTQFDNRLKFRLRDLESDRKALQDTKTKLKQYQNFTGTGDDSLNQATQLYRIGESIGHAEFYKKLYGVQMDGGDPLAVVDWSTKNNLPIGTTLTDVSRALVAAPTALPPVEGAFESRGILSALGLGGTGSDESKKLMMRLEGIAPYRKSSDLQLPTAELTGRLETEAEKTDRTLKETQLLQTQQNLIQFQALMPFKIDMARVNLTKGIRANILAKETFNADVSYAQDKARFMKGQADSEEFKVNNLLDLTEEAAKLKVVQLEETIDNLKNPNDLKKAKGAIIHEQFKIRAKLREETDPYEIPRLQDLLSDLTQREVRITDAIAQVDATATDDLKHYGALNSGYGRTLKHAIESSTLQGNPNIVMVPLREGGLTVRFTGESAEAKKQFDSVVFGAKRNFYSSLFNGYDKAGKPVFVSEAAKRSVQLNLGNDYGRVMDYHKISMKYKTAADFLRDKYANSFDPNGKRIDFKSVRKDVTSSQNRNKTVNIETNRYRVKLLEKIMNVYAKEYWQAEDVLKDYEKSVERQERQGG